MSRKLTAVAALAATAAQADRCRSGRTGRSEAANRDSGFALSLSLVAPGRASLKPHLTFRKEQK